MPRVKPRRLNNHIHCASDKSDLEIIREHRFWNQATIQTLPISEMVTWSFASRLFQVEIILVDIKDKRKTVTANGAYLFSSERDCIPIE